MGLETSKPDVEFEEFEFDRDQTRCQVLIGLVENHSNPKTWVFDQGWKIQELIVFKKQRAVLN